MSSAATPEKPFETFELCAALLLGLGAIGTAWAGYQGGLWGGAMTDAYSESAATTTKAAAIYNDELTSYIQDAQTALRAKELIWSGMEGEDEDLKVRNYEMASWMYVSQLSDPGYAALKLPADAKQQYETADVDAVYSEEVLKASLETDLDEDDSYENALFAGSEAEFKKAGDFLETARSANTVGDKFSLAGLIQTVGLFFAGLALVFKTRVRWGFLAAGTAVVAAGLGFMFTLPMA